MLRLVPAPKNKYMYIRSIYSLISDVGIRKKYIDINGLPFRTHAVLL